MKHSFWIRGLCIGVLITLPTIGVAQIEPQFVISEPISLFEESVTKEAGLAVNSREAEVLFVTIDTVAIDDDPITGEPAAEAVMGFYYNPETLTPIGAPFIIVGNPRGSLEKLSLTYNPVSNRYFVAVAANGYSPTRNRVPLMAIVNPSSAVANGEPPVFKAWNYDPETSQNYQDTAVAASSRNGNMLYVSEYSPAGESGEGVIGLLYDQDGNLLTPEAARLDQLEPDRDEDDPDVYYLEENDVFLFITNIDPSDAPDRITCTIIQTVPDADGRLQQGEQQIVSDQSKTIPAGHPSAIENPYTGELIVTLDYSNGADGGDVFYLTLGDAPNYVFSQSREPLPYLEARGGDPYVHRHPRLALDANSGVFIISHNAREGSFQGMVFTLLGPDGEILPGRPDDLYKLVETAQPVDNGANYHDVKWDPVSDSFLVIFATGAGVTNVVRLEMLSDHRPAYVSDWSLFDHGDL